MASENESESRETSADIADEIRHAVESMGDEMPYTVSAGTMRRVADRIEAAWRREKAEIETDALSVGGIVEAARHKPVGNAAAMRDALGFMAHLDDDSYTSYDIAVAIQEARAALSAPARNQEVLASPIDLNERFIHIGDSVHMMNTRDDGDHEWDDVVLSLEYVGKSGGDDWLVHGEDGAAWACECEVLKRKGEDDGSK